MAIERYNIQDSPTVKKWKYLEKKGAYKKGVELSKDGSFFVDSKGQTVARHITPSFERREIGLLWFGWFHRLDRVQKIISALNKRSLDFFEQKLEPALQKLVGNKKQATVWFDGEKALRCYNIELRPTDYFIQRMRSKKDRHKYKKETFSWSQSALSPDLKDFPPCQLPVASPEGNEFHALLEYSNDLYARLRRAESYLYCGIHYRLDELAEDYGVGDLVRFTIGQKPYIFKRTDKYRDWEQLSGEIEELDFSALPLKLPTSSEIWKYEHLRHNR